MLQNIDKKLLKIIVEEYVKTALPVGSGLVAELYLKNISSATVRNYMAVLEKEGMIKQPYTSAGRVPTVEGFKYYINEFVLPLKSKTKKIEIKFNNIKQAKELAKKVAEISDSAVIMASSKNDLYYTGISNLFRQPEFADHNMVRGISVLIDHLDEVIGDIYYKFNDAIEIWLGDNNPFGSDAGVILTHWGGQNKGLIALLGPVRMNYKKNYLLMCQVKKLLNKNYV